jgi:hypothetical protein
MNLKSPLLVGAALVLGAVALAQGVKQISATLAGQTLKLDSVVVGGKTYVSLEQLKTALGSNAGGANQVQAASGCLGAWLFNGAWRLRTQKVEWDAGNRVWRVTVELKNGMNRTASTFNNGADGTGQDLSLILQSGNTLSISPGDASGLQNALLFKTLQPGAAVVATVPFRAESDADKPAKLLWAMSPTNNSSRAPLGKDPAFRVDLTCQK